MPQILSGFFLIDRFRDAVEADAQRKETEVLPVVEFSVQEIAAAAAGGLEDRATT